MTFQIDGSLYPDTTPPTLFDSVEDRMDYVARLCSAWDFGLLPDWDTVIELRRDSWREAIDLCHLLTSPTYHLLRKWHNLPPLPYLGSIPAYIRDDPNLAYV